MVSGPRPGHRARLRQRFLAGGPRAFLDHEILEMLLAQVDTRRDTKARAYGLIDALAEPAAKAATGERPALGAMLAPVLISTPSEIAAAGVPGVGPAMGLHLGAVRSAAGRIAEASLMDEPVLGNWEAVVAYSTVRFAGASSAGLHVLFLDFRHRLMREPAEFHLDMPLDQFVREVMTAGLRRAASGLILIRNDPHDEVFATNEDFRRAEALKQTGGANAIILHDYMLTSRHGHMSLRSMGMLEVTEPYSAAQDWSPANEDGGEEEESATGLLAELQDQAMAMGADSLDDASLLGLLLRRAIGDESRLRFSEALVRRFGNLGRTLASPLEELCDAVGMIPAEDRTDAPEALAVHLGVVAESANRLLRGQVLARSVLNDTVSLVRYCRAALGYAEVEQFRVLFLDRSSQLFWDEAVSVGTVNHAPVQPREVAARALRLGADSIILVHNHPTGEPTPSLADIDMTRRICEACEAVGVAVRDHLIVAQTGHTSLAEDGKMPAAANGARPRKRQRKR